MGQRAFDPDGVPVGGTKRHRMTALRKPLHESVVSVKELHVFLPEEIPTKGFR
jgi:hypothetical protein